MRGKLEPLLCELHAHTRWSDGALTLSELVDLYGQNGFDVLAVTDHVVRPDDPWLPHDGPGCSVRGSNHADYLAEILAQAERARREYDLLLVAVLTRMARARASRRPLGALQPLRAVRLGR